MTRRLWPRVALAIGVLSAMLVVAVAARRLVRPPSCRGPVLARAPRGAVVPFLAQQGQLLVTHDRAGDASIVDVATGQATYLALNLTDPHEAAVSPDGRWGIVSDYGDRSRGAFQGHRVAVIDMERRRVMRVDTLAPSRGLHGVAFVPGREGIALVTAQSSRHLVMLDVRNGDVLARMDTGADGSHLVAVSPDGRYAYTGNEGDGSVSRFDLAARTRVARFPVAATRAEGVAVTPDGSRLWVGSHDPGTVYEVRTDDGAVVDSMTGFRSPDRIVLPPAGGAALVMDDGCVHVLDRANRQPQYSVVGLGGSFATSPDGRLAFLIPREASIVVVDVAARQEVARHPLRERPHGAAWGPVPD